MDEDSIITLFNKLLLTNHTSYATMTTSHPAIIVGKMLTMKDNLAKDMALNSNSAGFGNELRNKVLRYSYYKGVLIMQLINKNKGSLLDMKYETEIS